MYTEAYLGGAIIPQSNAFLTTCSLTSTSTYMRYFVLDSIKINRLLANVTTTLAASTASAVVTYLKRVTQGSDSGAVTIGTLTFVNGLAAGSVLYKDVESTSLQIGDELCIKVTTACTDASSAAGAAFLGFKAFARHEDPQASSHASESA